MSEEHRLPDDPRAWPSDWHRVFGVPRAADRGQLKRAYHRLLRRYKPEHAPEEFRRLREAYESALQFIEYRELYADDHDEEELTPVELITPPKDAAADQSKRRAVVDDSPDALWARHLVTSGNTDLLYQKLVSRHWHEPQPALFAQLYWLLRLEPGLDRHRDSVDWLVEGMCRAVGDAHLLSELYRRQLERDAREAFSSRFDRLLTEQPRANWLPQLLTVRWRVAQQHNQWQVIVHDLHQVLRATGGLDEHYGQWQLMSMAVERLGPIYEPRAFDALRSVMDRLETTFGADPRFYDQLAMLDARLVWFRERNAAAKHPMIDQELLALTTRLSDLQPHEYRGMLLSLVRKTSPRDLFTRLTLLNAYFELIAGGFAHLVDGAEMYGPELDDADWPQPLLLRVVHEFFDLNTKFKGRHLVDALLDFCVDNMVAPQQLATLVDAGGSWTSDEWRTLDAVANDVWIDLTYRAFRLYRAV